MAPIFVQHASSIKSDTFDIYEELRKLLRTVDVNLDAPGVDTIDIKGRDPLVKTARFRYGAVAALPMLAVAVVTAQIHFARTGESQDISIDLRTAYHNHSFDGALNSSTLARKPHNTAILATCPFLHDCYKTKDERFITPVAVYLEHRLQWYSLLKVPPYPAKALEAAFGRWDAKELEDAAAHAHLPCSTVLTAEEWRDSAHGSLMVSNGPVPTKKIGDGPVKNFPPPVPGRGRPLEGIKILMCTHAIAGPSAGRVLAEHGARVLQVFRPRLGFEHEAIYNEANVGCRSTQLDLSGNTPGDLETFWDLIKEADAFIESFAPSALTKYGITDENLVRANPNIIISHTKCYGTEGPWSDRKGHDQNASSSVGLLNMLAEHKRDYASFLSGVEGKKTNGKVNGAHSTQGHQSNGSHTNGTNGDTTGHWEDHETEQLTPVWPEPRLVNDFTTGLFSALGICAALLKRSVSGGAYALSPALAQTCTWYVHQLPLVPHDVFRDAVQNGKADYQLQAPSFITGQTPKGEYRRPGHLVQMSRTPLEWSEPLIHVQGSEAPTFAW